MAKLIYASNMSLDSCTEDARGAFDWAPLDDDVFAFITQLMRSAGTYLYGRRMYETLAVWETDPALAAQSDLTADYASAWRSARCSPARRHVLSGRVPTPDCRTGRNGHAACGRRSISPHG